MFGIGSLFHKYYSLIKMMTVDLNFGRKISAKKMLVSYPSLLVASYTANSCMMRLLVKAYVVVCAQSECTKICKFQK